MLRLARVLVPLNYARGERFDHDPAMKLPAVPRFEAATAIAATPPGVVPNSSAIQMSAPRSIKRFAALY